jgi:hypothetical protein
MLDFFQKAARRLFRFTQEQFTRQYPQENNCSSIWTRDEK